MKEFVEKLIGRLEEMRKMKVDMIGGYCQSTISKSIEIVNQLAEEYGKDTNVTTNADHIRNMSDEELAELFAEKCKIGKEFAMCWLQSEVKGSE